MRLLTLCGVAASASAFMFTPPTLGAARRGGCSLAVSASLDEDGLERIRERQRLRASGAPMSEWAALSDVVDDRPAHTPASMPAELQQAVNADFEQRFLSERAPAGFGEGLDQLANSEPTYVRAEPEPWVDSVRKTVDDIDGFERFRERQRLRARGAPMGEWAALSDVPDDRPAYTPSPPPTELVEAVNADFEESFYGDELPEGFGEGLEGHF
jgi:hypothetical protein